MPTPTGTISLSDVNIELGFSSTATISMDTAAVRTLAGVGGSGTAISMDNLRGKTAGGSGLYTFTNVRFNAGTTGNTGPTLAQVQAAMTGTPTPSGWNTNAAYLAVNSGIILWTAPSTATYRIEAAGAQGGNTGGQGAVIRGDFSLTQGQKLRIVVGQAGIGTGGGGGSYVVRETGSTNSDIFVIAGGGGGKSGGSGGTATVTNAAGNVSNGNGGLANAGSWNGPAGGGFFTSGTVSTGSPRGNVGAGFLQGSAGGAGTGGGTGGFGGGGSGGADSAAGGGCGGGYSGGSGGPDGSVGTGAGSYPNGANQAASANLNTGSGYVLITRL